MYKLTIETEGTLGRLFGIRNFNAVTEYFSPEAEKGSGCHLGKRGQSQILLSCIDKITGMIPRMSKTIGEQGRSYTR